MGGVRRDPATLRHGRQIPAELVARACGPGRRGWRRQCAARLPQLAVRGRRAEPGSRTGEEAMNRQRSRQTLGMSIFAAAAVFGAVVPINEGCAPCPTFVVAPNYKIREDQ